MNFENLKPLTEADAGATALDFMSGKWLMWDGERWLDLSIFGLTKFKLL